MDPELIKYLREKQDRDARKRTNEIVEQKNFNKALNTVLAQPETIDLSEADNNVATKRRRRDPAEIIRDQNAARPPPQNLVTNPVTSYKVKQI